MSEHRVFLRWWLGTVLAIVALVAALNFAVDPYGIFGVPRIVGFNAKKPTAGTRVRIVKPYQVLDVKPRTLILGNSRPELGLNPAQPCWDAKDRPVYSLTIPGSGVYMEVRYAQHALSAAPIRTILYGVDFLDFLVPAEQREGQAWPPPTQDFESRLRVKADGAPNPGYRWQWWKDRLEMLFSTDAVVDSLDTLAGQWRSGLSSRTEQGFHPATEYYKGLIRTAGQSVLFKQKNMELVESLAGHKWKLIDQETGSSLAFRSLDALIAQAERRDIKLVLFVNPYHTDYLLDILIAGQWGRFNAWERELVKRAAGHPGVTVWDFNSVNRYSRERPSAKVDGKSVSHWFWEPAHYSEAVGDMMLAQMLGDGCFDATASSPLPGVRLSADNIDRHLRGLTASVRAFAQANRARVQELERFLPNRQSASPSELGSGREMPSHASQAHFNKRSRTRRARTSS